MNKISHISDSIKRAATLLVLGSTETVRNIVMSFNKIYRVPVLPVQCQKQTISLKQIIEVAESATFKINTERVPLFDNSERYRQQFRAHAKKLSRKQKYKIIHNRILSTNQFL